MFEALFVFAEESVFGVINRIINEEADLSRCVERVLSVLLMFSARNPGITRILIGDALVGEQESLRARGEQFFTRFEVQIKQVLNKANLDPGRTQPIAAGPAANLLMAVVEGRMSQFSRSGFARPPTDDWDKQWPVLAVGLFEGASRSGVMASGHT